MEGIIKPKKKESRSMVYEKTHKDIVKADKIRQYQMYIILVCHAMERQYKNFKLLFFTGLAVYDKPDTVILT